MGVPGLTALEKGITPHLVAQKDKYGRSRKPRST